MCLAVEGLKHLIAPQLPVFPVEFLHLCVWLSIVCKGWAALTWGFHRSQFFKQKNPQKNPTQHCDFYHVLLYWGCSKLVPQTTNSLETAGCVSGFGEGAAGQGWVCWEQAGIDPPMCAQILGGLSWALGCKEWPMSNPQLWFGQVCWNWGRKWVFKGLWLEMERLKWLSDTTRVGLNTGIAHTMVCLNKSFYCASSFIFWGFSSRENLGLAQCEECCSVASFPLKHKKICCGVCSEHLCPYSAGAGWKVLLVPRVPPLKGAEFGHHTTEKQIFSWYGQIWSLPWATDSRGSCRTGSCGTRFTQNFWIPGIKLQNCNFPNALGSLWLCCAPCDAAGKLAQ